MDQWKNDVSVSEFETSTQGLLRNATNSVARFTTSSRCRRASRTQIVTRESSRSRRDAQARSLATIPRKRRPPCPPAAAQRGSRAMMLPGSIRRRLRYGRQKSAGERVDFFARPPGAKLPPGITATTKYQNLDSERRALQQQHQDMKQQLAKVRAEKQKNGATSLNLRSRKPTSRTRWGGSRVANSTIPGKRRLLSSSSKNQARTKNPSRTQTKSLTRKTKRNKSRMSTLSRSAWLALVTVASFAAASALGRQIG